MAFFDIALRAILGFVFFTLTALLLREGAALLRLDASMRKASEASLALTALLLFFSFIPAFPWLLFIIVGGFFFLVHYLYALDWMHALYLWLFWLAGYVLIGALVTLLFTFI
ncbi:MAG TPA: hypothetical protein VJC16_05315 [Candidatus Nanoarchaeia archaeon]|nr:hypothetical protein [Candidatus Nanoarchaeia archaeon]